jgi:Ser/Thr protein kinase RdoA (MazF antagonist)
LDKGVWRLYSWRVAQLEDFYALSPEKMLDLIESSLPERGRATGYCWPLNSLENRVVEMDFEDGSRVVAKFYRPGRWSEAQLREEHLFVQALEDAEVPVVSALELKPSKWADKTSTKTLCRSHEDIYFCAFPKCQGRIENELGDEQLRLLGRFLGRIHSVGKGFPAKARWKLDARAWVETSIKLLEQGGFLSNPMAERYKQSVSDLLPLLIERTRHLPLQAIHGDCHLGNTLWFADKPLFLDFDDMMMGPPVQDIWMIIRGNDDEARRQRETLLSSYESMCDFAWETLSSIEALRAMRIIHFSGWIARRWSDPSFPKTFVNFGRSEYWQEEIVALENIRESLTG